ncbi:hypothetical protein Y1Q_0023454 [Alligator mississippiensis]|uniref:Uncharacterized protein n=1 Tax=Alligator mississippiensis TaxID=8496 RepID=A0A151NPR3_ALLMI|nr:hypothetical protein Y1Q_0023454 [Alligator mississippiensis]
MCPCIIPSQAVACHRVKETGGRRWGWDQKLSLTQLPLIQKKWQCLIFLDHLSLCIWVVWLSVVPYFSD